MESVGIPEEVIKLNTPVPEPHIITSSSSPVTFLPQLSNPAADITLVSENDGIEANKYGATEKVLWDKGGKYPYSAVGGIRDCHTLLALH